MSTTVLPSLPGLAWPVIRTSTWSTDKQTNISGKEVSVGKWSYPQYTWQVLFNILRIGLVNGSTWDEMQQLFGFYNERNGGTDSFLYIDDDDNVVINQQIAQTDGVTSAFQLCRSLGVAVPVPVFAPNLGLAYSVYLNTTLQSGGSYTITPWDTANPNGPGMLVFNSPPVAGQVVFASFSYYWPCRFDQDTCDFQKMMDGRYCVKKLAFSSIK